MEDIGLTFWEKNEYESPNKDQLLFFSLGWSGAFKSVMFLISSTCS